MQDKKRGRSVYIVKDPNKQRSNSMIEETGLGDSSSIMFKKIIKTGEILDHYNFIIKSKVQHTLSQSERWSAGDFGCLFDILKTFQKTLQLRQEQHQQLTKTYKELKSQNYRQQILLERMIAKNKQMSVENSSIKTNLIELRQDYIKRNTKLQAKQKFSSIIESDNRFGKQQEESRSRLYNLQGPLISKVKNEVQQDPQMLIIPNILESYKPESDKVNLLNAQRPRVASQYNSKQPAFNKTSSTNQSELKLEIQMIKLNNPLMSKISSNPETYNNPLFLQEKKAPQVKKDNFFNRKQYK